MSTDIIELGSSDDERHPPPKKKKILPNAMVRIPPHTQFPGITIKSPKNKKIISNVGINNVINPFHANNAVLNPILKKVSITSGSLPTQFNVYSSKSMGSKLLHKLPSSITVKKATTSRVLKIPIKRAAIINATVGKVVQHPIGSDKKFTQISKPLPQWYKKPEDLESVTQIQENQSNDKNMTSMEEKNNREPAKLIEITIDDSPVKVSADKQIAITIEDSPDKGATKMYNELKHKKEKHSKKLLNYENIKIVENSTGMIEVEVDAIDLDQASDQPCSKESIDISHNDGQKVGQDASDKSCTENLKENLDSEQLRPKNETDFSHEKKENNDMAVQVFEKDKVKECASRDNEFNAIYQKFIDTCFRVENSNDMQQIVEKKIKSYYRQSPKEYTNSEEFLDLVSGKILAIEASPNKMYLYIRDVVDELNTQRKKVNTGTLTKKETEPPDNNLDTSECDTKHQRQIKKLEKTLAKLHWSIQKLEEQEVDFDEEEDSIYLLTDRYKERFVQVHAKFCQLTKTKMPSEPYIKLECLPGRPKGPVARLEKWINKKVPIGKPLPFPDFHDVLRCVREANTEDKLGLSETDILDEARELFTSCGKKLKRRRQENEWRIAASRLTVIEDPAEGDKELKEKLDQNKMLAKRNESDILNKYVERQNQLKLEPEAIGDKEAEDSPIESEDDNESVLQIEEEKDIKKEKTNVSNESKDEYNLLQKLYSQSDTDSENERSSPIVINSDVISIEDSSYSESETCNRANEPDTGPAQMDIDLSEDFHIRNTESRNGELTVGITKDVQGILSSNNERENISVERVESPKECINNIDECNDEIEIINDSCDIGIEKNDVNVNTEVVTDNSICERNDITSDVMVNDVVKDKVEINDVSQALKENTASETTIIQVDNESSKANLNDTNQHIAKEMSSNEFKKIETDVEMMIAVATIGGDPVDDKNYEIQPTKGDIDVTMNAAEVEIEKQTQECKEATVEIKSNDFQINEANRMDVEKGTVEIEMAEKDTDFKIVDTKEATKDDEEIVNNDNIDMEHTDVDDVNISSRALNEINSDSTDKLIAKNDNVETGRTDSVTSVNIQVSDDAEDICSSTCS